jgi:uncharacterized protein (TIRG00374 family)
LKTESEACGSAPKPARILRYAVIVTVIFALLVSFTNLRKLKDHFLNPDPLFMAFALLCACGLYLLEGVFLKTTLKLFGERLALGRAFRYSFVINAIGYLVSLCGLTSFATQAYVLAFSGITARKATLTRIVQVVFFNLFFDLFLIAGFVFLVRGGEFAGFRGKTLVVALFGAFLILITFAYLMLFLRRLQKAVLTRAVELVGRVVGCFSKNARPLDVSRVFSYLGDFNEGVGRLLANPALLVTLAAITLFDWLLWIGVLYCSFGALRRAIRPGILIVGFSVGQIVGIASMVPGGMGTLEGSMALVYSLFGIPLHVSLGAALLNRVFLYIIPFVASLPMHVSLRRER